MLYNTLQLMKGEPLNTQKIKIKVTLSLDKRTLDLLDKYAKDNFLESKSQAIRVLVQKDAEYSKTKDS